MLKIEAGVATYKIPELGIRRSFSPGETKRLAQKSLKSSHYRPEWHFS